MAIKYYEKETENTYIETEKYRYDVHEIWDKVDYLYYNQIFGIGDMYRFITFGNIQLLNNGTYNEIINSVSELKDSEIDRVMHE